MDSKIEFISYTGKYPSLCMGVFTVKINGKEYRFGHDHEGNYYSYDGNSIKFIDGNLSEFWMSGGKVRGDDYGDLYAEINAWVLDKEDHKDYPEEIRELLPELIKVFNDNVSPGCCGGCI